MKKDLTKNYILAVDTSSLNLSLAIWRGERLLGRKNLSGPKGKSHMFTYALSELLKKTKVTLDKIKTAGFGLGPGSYTGLRIGLASLKALLVSQKQMKAFGFSSLDLIASGIKKDLFGVIVDARRDRIYANFYKRENGVLKHLSESPALLSSDKLSDRIKCVSKDEKIALAGDALVRYAKIIEKIKNCEPLRSTFWYPKAENALGLIHHQAHCGKELSLYDVRPLYMRRSEAEEKWGLCYDERDDMHS